MASLDNAKRVIIYSRALNDAARAHLKAESDMAWETAAALGFSDSSSDSSSSESDSESDESLLDFLDDLSQMVENAEEEEFGDQEEGEEHGDDEEEFKAEHMDAGEPGEGAETDEQEEQEE
jgi:hypothetical protein